MLSKKQTAIMEQLITSVWDLQEASILVVRKKHCQLLFTSEADKKRSGPPVQGSCISSDHRGSLCPSLCNYCELETQEKFDAKDADGHLYSVMCKKILWLDRQPATLFVIREVSEERRIAENQYKLAYIDSLTQIPNRQKLKEDFHALEQEIAEGRKKGIVALFDLDNFKTINDTYGHATGDLMLKRLTEHLESDPVFAGHLYRIGGDEFVLLYADDYDLDEDPVDHYRQLLNGVLLSYSMPNIEVCCTVSMGVAAFPQHGKTMSELLRKADIALYQGKGNGRNQIVFFEDQFDLAKKFRNVYVTISPLLDVQGRTLGYELVDGSNSYEGDLEKTDLIDFNRTIDILGLDELSNDQHYFLNYANQMLNCTIANIWKDKFVIQIPVHGPTCQESLQKYIKLHHLGYPLAFKCADLHDLSPQMLNIAHYIKINLHDNKESEIRTLLQKYPQINFIATDVNHSRSLSFAKKLGFHLFQGYYFRERPPIMKKTKNIEPIKSSYYQLLKLTCTGKEVDFREISKVISSDLAMSYQLLKLINSVAMGLGYQISSISMAVTYLGENTLRKWAALLGLRGVAPHQPLELIRLSLIRARFGELLSVQMDASLHPDHAFFTGLLSLLHVALEKTQEEFLDEMPLAEDIRASFLSPDGKYADLLDFFKNYEYADWVEVGRFAEKYQLNSHMISEAYIKSVKWYKALTEEKTNFV